jgi:hypothetical protein
MDIIMIEPTILEKCVVNLYTPLDKLGHLLPKKTLDKLTKKYGKLPENCLQDTSKKKIQSYKLLINRLANRPYNEKFMLVYTHNPCGRLQLFLAKHRRYLSKEQYEALLGSSRRSD